MFRRWLGLSNTTDDTPTSDASEEEEDKLPSEEMVSGMLDFEAGMGPSYTPTKQVGAMMEMHLSAPTDVASLISPQVYQIICLPGMDPCVYFRLAKDTSFSWKHYSNPDECLRALPDWLADVSVPCRRRVATIEVALGSARSFMAALAPTLQSAFPRLLVVLVVTGDEAYDAFRKEVDDVAGKRTYLRLPNEQEMNALVDRWLYVTRDSLSVYCKQLAPVDNDPLGAEPDDKTLELMRYARPVPKSPHKRPPYQARLSAVNQMISWREHIHAAAQNYPWTVVNEWLKGALARLVASPCATFAPFAEIAMFPGQQRLRQVAQVSVDTFGFRYQAYWAAVDGAAMSNPAPFKKPRPLVKSLVEKTESGEAACVEEDSCSTEEVIAWPPPRSAKKDEPEESAGPSTSSCEATPPRPARRKRLRVVPPSK